MKKRRFTPMLIAAGLLTTLNFGTAIAQPNTTSKPKTNKPAKERKPTVTKRLATAIEAKTGKPLTQEQKAKLGEAAKARQAAIDAATEKYMTDAAAVVGLTAEEFRELTKPARRNSAGAAKPAAAAPAATGEEAAPTP